MSETLLSFTSHIDGKNANVEVFEDRIEWTRAGRLAIGKASLAAATGGLSLAAKGGRSGSKGAGTEMIPIKSISSVTTKKDGMTQWAVSVVTSGNTIDMRVSKGEAEQVKSTLQRLMLAPAAPMSVIIENPTPAPVADDSLAQIQKLAELRDAGILTEEEFAAKKAQLLGL